MLETPIALVVEDDSNTSDFIAEILKGAGYETVQASANSEGLRLVSEMPFSLITTDCARPGESGIDFVTQVRSMPNGRRVPILMVSGSLTHENELAAWRAGVSGVMHKPFGSVEFLAEVQKLSSKTAEKDGVPLGVGAEDLSKPEGKCGIRGWLLLLCLLLTMVKGTGFIVTLLQAMISSETRLLYSFYAIYFALGASTGVLLWTKAPIAVTYAKVFYVVQPYAVAFFWFRFMKIDPSSVSSGLFAIIQATTFSVVWFSYLTFSRRVRNTYKVNAAQRNALVAFIMGAAMGPLGTIYFHFRIFLMVAFGTLVATTIGVLVARIFGLHLPPWLGFVWLGFFPIANTILSINWNDSMRDSGSADVDWSTASVFGVVFGIWEFRIIGITTAIYGAIALFGQHHIFLAIVLLVLLPWAMSVPAKWIMTVVAAIVGFFVGIRRSNV